jgi:alkaline phosphatase
VLLLAAGCERAPSTPFNAVLLIGDGMGSTYVTAARHTLPADATLMIDRLPYTAILQTHSASHLVTDSAAAATAMACGQLTSNGVLGEDATAVLRGSPGARLETVAEWAAARGILVGIVTNTTVTHATPAAWYAHANNRAAEADIAPQLRASRLTFVLGGGARYFPSSADWSPWQVVRDAASLPAGPAAADRHLLGVFADNHLPFEDAADRGQAPRLADLAAWALHAMTSSGRPFLLVIEGGRIDFAAHNNLARTAIRETLAFDAVVEQVVGGVDPAATLVLVAADHETGGFSLNGYPTRAQGIFGTTAFGPVLTFASGPGLTTAGDERPVVRDDRRRSLIPIGSAMHTGDDVTLYAWGQGAESVHGTVDHTAIYRLLRHQLERNPPSR